MEVIRVSEHERGRFTNYFLAFPSHEKLLPTAKELAQSWINPISSQQGVLELCWNWGTEKDPNFEGYVNGNEEPKGFGHIAVAVDDVQAASDRFEGLDVKFKKRPSEGSMKNIAFILDPDGTTAVLRAGLMTGYWIELVANRETKET
jgi:lactoylglutathione lyase